MKTSSGQIKKKYKHTFEVASGKVFQSSVLRMTTVRGGVDSGLLSNRVGGAVRGIE